MRSRLLAALIVGLVLGALPATPALASGTDLWVDVNTGDDGLAHAPNDCLSQGNPCASIHRGLAAASTGDTVHVDDGVYNDNVTVGGGRSLIYENFDGGDDGGATINGGANVAVAVSTSDAGLIDGFTITSAKTPMSLSADATVQHNTFSQSTAPTYDLHEDVIINTGSPLLVSNTFDDGDTSDDQIGVLTYSTDSPQISGNSFSGLDSGVYAFAGTPDISGNDISNVGGAGGAGAGINVVGGHPTLTENRISAPATAYSTGINVAEHPTSNQTGATLSRNQISGAYAPGIRVESVEDAVTLDSDLVTGMNIPLDIYDSVTATNETYDAQGPNPADVVIRAGGHLTLDSSVMASGSGIADLNGGGSNCTITNSFGPTSSGSLCETFQHTGSPGFDPVPARPYHLKSDSQLIDSGNGADPTQGALDLDGDPRACDGNGDGWFRRDIGADEFVPASGCTRPPPPPNDAFAQAELLTGTYDFRHDESNLTAGTEPGEPPSFADGHTLWYRWVPPYSGNVLLEPCNGGPIDALPSATVWVDTGGGIGSLVDQPPATVNPPGGSHCVFELTFGAVKGATYYVRLDSDGGPGLLGLDLDLSPETRIKRIKVSGGSATVRFAATGGYPGIADEFTCKVDSKKARSCKSGVKFRSLRRGRHRVMVTAKDATGNTDPTPAVKKFRI